MKGATGLGNVSHTAGGGGGGHDPLVCLEKPTHRCMPSVTCATAGKRVNTAAQDTVRGGGMKAAQSCCGGHFSTMLLGPTEPGLQGMLRTL